MTTAEVNWKEARLNLEHSWITVDRLPQGTDSGVIREHFADITRPDKLHEVDSYLLHLEEVFPTEQLEELRTALFTLLVSAFIHTAAETVGTRVTLTMFMDKDDKGDYIVSDDAVHVMARILGHRIAW